jgi:hypothetical protein
MDCRYVGPSEACHRLFGNPMHGAQPPVIKLQVHLPNYQSIVYAPGGEQTAIQNPPSTQLLAYFQCVRECRLPDAIRPQAPYKSATELTYDEMPEHYTYNVTNHVWKARQQQKKGFIPSGAFTLSLQVRGNRRCTSFALY